jgi:hypothetical protein
MNSCIAPPRLARAACSRGVQVVGYYGFLMYRLGRLVVLVYIRQPLQHRGGAHPCNDAYPLDGYAPPLRRSRGHRAGEAIVFITLTKQP